MEPFIIIERIKRVTLTCVKCGKKSTDIVNESVPITKVIRALGYSYDSNIFPVQNEMDIIDVLCHSCTNLLHR